VVYWPGEGDVQAGEEVNLTPTITGCEGQAQCPFDAFVARSQPFQLLPSAKEVF
jgi:hypothetical protein